MIQTSGEEVDFPLANEDDETNTVIENECENDYQNLYSSVGLASNTHGTVTDSEGTNTNEDERRISSAKKNESNKGGAARITSAGSNHNHHKYHH